MLKTITKSKAFKIYNDTNHCKLNSIIDKAKNILEYKQMLSPLICNDFLNFLDLSKIDFIKKYNPINPKNISGQDAQKALEDVFVAYENKKETAIDKIKFQVQKNLNFGYYKKNTENYPKGSVKHCSVILQSTKLTKICTYLAKYYQENTLEYLTNKILSNKNDISKLEVNDLQIIKLNNQNLFYSEVIYYLNKFGKRIINLSLNKREMVMKKVTEYPINFQSLTFRSTNRIKHEIIAKNKNYKSIYNAFIVLGAYGENNERIEIPTKYDDKFHGNLERYTSKTTKEDKDKKQWDTAYTIAFEVNKPIKIVLTIEEEEDIPVDRTNYLGVDTNIKHNLFCTSSDKIIDYDREMIDNFCKFILKQDKQQKLKISEENKNPDKSKKQLRDFQFKNKQMISMIKEKCSELVKLAKFEGKDHLIIEDLGQFAKGFIKSDEFEGMKYTRLIRLLKLSNVKNYIKSIGNKNGVQVTFVHPEYTSKTCPRCGNIDDNNRKSQEIFCCTECGFRCNADYNSALNILNRLAKDVLRLNLLKKDSFGYETKRIRKEVIREFIELAYSTLKDDCVRKVE